jgi:hypothetical protein
MSKQPVPEVAEEMPQMPKLWQPEVDLKELKIEMPKLEAPSSDTFLKSLLQRKHEKGPDSYKLQLEMHGVFSLPDQWRAKIVISTAVT